MEIIVSEDFDLTPAIKQAVHERVEQILDHLKARNKESTPVNVFLSKNSGSEYKVRLLMKVKQKEISSLAESSDFHKCLNDAKQKLIRQVNDLKEKTVTKRQH